VHFVRATDADGMRTSAAETNSAGKTTLFEWYYDNLNRFVAEDYTGTEKNDK
jgi:hypothetical protein